MFELVLAVALFALVFDIAIAVYFAKKAKLGSAMDRIEEWIQEWREHGGLDQYVFQDESGQWQMDARIGQIVDFVGSRIALSMRQAFYQQMGVNRKLEKHVDQALAGDIMNGSGIGGILDLLGMHDTKKVLANNPKTLGLILQRVAPLLSQFQQRSASGGAPSNFGWNPR